MKSLRIYHYPNCHASQNALDIAQELGVEHEVVLYIKTPPTREELENIIAVLEDPVEDLVRKDAKFKALGLEAEEFINNAQLVIDILLKHKQLLQRPILVTEGKAIIGRPKARVRELLETGHF